MKRISILLFGLLLYQLNQLKGQTANAGEDIFLYTPNNQTVLSALPPDPPFMGWWEIICGGGIFFDENDPSSMFVNGNYGANVLVWHITDESFTPIDQDTVIVYQDYLPPIYCDEVISYCTEPASIELTHSAGPLATYYWETISGSATMASSEAPSTLVTDFTAGVTIIQSSSTENCITHHCTHTIEILGNGIVDAGEDVNTLTCLSDEIILNGSIPTNNAIGTWTQDPDWSAVSLSDIHDPHATILEEFYGQAHLTWTIENVGPCQGTGDSDDVVLISFYEDPYIPNAGEDQMTCSNTAQLSGSIESFPYSGNESYWTLIQGQGEISNPNVYNPVVSNLAIGENIFRLNQQTVCEGILHDDISVFVMDNMTVDAGPDVTICVGQSLQLNATSTSSGAAFQWSPPVGLSATNIPNPIVSALTQVTYIVTATWGNGCSNSDAITIFTNPIPAVSAGIDTTICLTMGPVQLFGVPSGGTWSGVNVTASGMLQPTSEGSYSISYTYTNNGGCSASDSRIIDVIETGNGCPGGLGCMDPLACNYDSTALLDDGLCIYPLEGQEDCLTIEDLLGLLDNFGCINSPECAPYDLDGDGIVGVSDLIILMGQL